MGKVIAILLFIGGITVIRSVLTPTVSTPYLLTGSIVLLIALILFIKELRKI